jgi:hypothetical protein
LGRYHSSSEQMEPPPLIIRSKQRSYWLSSFLLYQMTLRRKEPGRKGQ